ncbi:MAG: molecular chaperone HtpG [Peptoniphilaceae bacterium]|nr:molecular chaperone HtpG [Peptoniphilaceae bacterium]MDY6018206.1 molecular chaperone HtpG [Anaerococcus sp.]
MRQEFKAEAKKIMDLMINSIYTEKEIFLRELISNASDALDKRYYEDLKSEKEVNKDDYYIELIADKDKRKLTVKDTGIGMDETDLIENLGTIAKSGTEAFKKEMKKEEIDQLIGQFGVGFYSSFMVADKVSVKSKKLGSDKAYIWTSQNADGYSIEEIEKDEVGTEVILYLKENQEDESYDSYLDPYYLKNLVVEHSNYIRFPIKMLMTKSRPAKDSTEDKPKYEEYKEYEILNSETPIWKKNKKELTEEDYKNFYRDQGFGYDEPLSYLHLNIEGLVSFKALIYIPKKAPFDYYSKDYQKGLQLYSHGVKIQDRSEDLIEDAYSFAKGVVESDDISLNISRQTLQRDKQLRFIAKQLNKKIKDHLLDMQKNKREDYETFFKEFGNTIKMALYESYGMNKSDFEDLLLFYSRKEDKLINLKEYKDKMASTQENILYAVGPSLDRIKKSPQLESVDENVDVLLLTEKLDEFLIKMLGEYKEKKFKSINQVDDEEVKEEDKDDILKQIKKVLPDEVVEVKFTDKLGELPSMIKQRGEISIEMEKTLKNQPNAPEIKAEKVLEINKNSKAYELLEKTSKEDEDKFKILANLLLDQAKLIEGLEIEDPIAYAKNMWKLI